MAQVSVEKIRNIALVGHGDSGKTTLAEALLHKAGVINRRGQVIDGTTVSDFEQDEKDRQHSLRAATMHWETGGTRVNLIDCPGYPDFVGETFGAIRAVETAMICISATGGVAVNTRAVWALAKDEGVSRVIVVTKLNGENIDLDGLVNEIRETFGEKCHLWDVPDGTGADFSAVYSVLNPPSDVPAGIKEKIDSLKDPLMEAIVEVDDSLVERYLDGEELSEDEIAAAATKSIAKGLVFPILFVSAEKDVGLAKLNHFIEVDVPSPKDGVQRPVYKVDSDDEIETPPADVDAPFLAQVFRVVTDPFVGKLAFFRVYSGSLPDNGMFLNPRIGKPEKVGNLIEVVGKEQTNVSSAQAGDIVAMSKVDSLKVGDTITDEKFEGRMAKIPHPTPMVSLAIEPKKRGDEGKIGTALTRLSDEDPTFRVIRGEQTGELVISGMSNLHLDVILARLKKRFEVEVDTRIPAIPYKETISGTGDAKYRHKKQTGGAGQFGEVWLRIAPLTRGEDFKFVNATVGGSIPQQYLSSCEKGVRGAMTEGIVSGNKVVDVEVTVYDGKHHPVDSKDIAFQIAARKAFQDAFQQAKPVLLEPIMHLKVTVPSTSMGDITGDLNGRRGRIQGMETVGNFQVVEAEVPLAEMSTYSTELRSMTGGEGFYSMTFAREDVVPANVAQEIMAKSKKVEEED